MGTFADMYPTGYTEPTHSLRSESTGELFGYQPDAYPNPIGPQQGPPTPTMASAGPTQRPTGPGFHNFSNPATWQTIGNAIGLAAPWTHEATKVLMAQQQQQQRFEFQKQQAAQQQAAQQKQEDREGLTQGFGLFKTISNLPLGSAARKYATKKFGSIWASVTGQPADPDFLKMMETADEEESAALQDALAQFIKEHPEAGASGMGKLIASRPELVMQFIDKGIEGYKARTKAESDKASDEAIGRALSQSEAPESPGSPPIPQDSAPGRGAGLTQPGPWEGPQNNNIPYLATPEGKAIQQFVVQRAEALGIRPQLAQALIHQESQWDPEAKSPTGVVGLAQVTNGTGRDYGQTPDTRTNPRVSANAGLMYFAGLLKANGGDEDKALMRYNGGSDPQFVQNVRRHEKHYTGLPSPHSQAVQEAPGPFQAAVAGMDKEIDNLSEALKKLRAIPGEKANKLRDDIRGELKLKMDHRKDMESRYNLNTTGEFRDWLLANSGFRNASDIPQEKLNVLYQQWQKDKQDRAEGISKRHGERAAEISLEKEKEGIVPLEQLRKFNLSLPMDQRLGGGATWRDVKASGAKPLEDMTPVQLEATTGRAELIQSLQEVVDGVGTIATGPLEGRMERWQQAFGINATDEKAAYRLLLNKLTNDTAFNRGGKALTANEIERVKAELPLDTDVGSVFAAKAKKALELAKRFHARHSAALRENGTFVPSVYTPQEKVAVVPKTDTDAIPPVPVSPGVQKALDILNGVKP